jgi:FkbM family methyltransferase
MRNLVTISGHTFDQSILNGWVVIDVGCRDFEFASNFRKCEVFCIDPDPDVFVGAPRNVTCLNVAISDKNGKSTYYRNGEMSVLTDIYKPYAHLYTECKTITMDHLYEMTGPYVDLLKLDCEGAEYIILGDGFKPIPKQISVEFHKHTVPEYHELHYQKCLDNLLKYYDKVYEHKTLMDTLFVRK